MASVPSGAAGNTSCRYFQTLASWPQREAVIRPLAEPDRLSYYLQVDRAAKILGLGRSVTYRMQARVFAAAGWKTRQNHPFVTGKRSNRVHRLTAPKCPLIKGIATAIAKKAYPSHKKLALFLAKSVKHLFSWHGIPASRLNLPTHGFATNCEWLLEAFEQNNAANM